MLSYRNVQNGFCWIYCRMKELQPGVKEITILAEYQHSTIFITYYDRIFFHRNKNSMIITIRNSFFKRFSSDNCCCYWKFFIEEISSEIFVAVSAFKMGRSIGNYVSFYSLIVLYYLQ